MDIIYKKKSISYKFDKPSNRVNIETNNNNIDLLKNVYTGL